MAVHDLNEYVIYDVHNPLLGPPDVMVDFATLPLTNPLANAVNMIFLPKKM